MAELFVTLVFAVAEHLSIRTASVVSFSTIVISVGIQQTGIEAGSYWPLMAIGLLVLMLAIFGQIAAYLLGEIRELKAEKEVIRGKYEAVIAAKDAELMTKQTMIDRLLK